MLAENRSVKNPPQLSRHFHIFNYLPFPGYAQNHIVLGHVSIICPTKASPVFSPKPPGTKWTPYTYFMEGRMTERLSQAQRDPIYHFMGNEANLLHPAASARISSQIKNILQRAQHTLFSPFKYVSFTHACICWASACVSASCNSQPLFIISSL